MKLSTGIITSVAACSMFAATNASAVTFAVAEYDFTGGSLASSDSDAVYTSASDITEGGFDDNTGGLLGVQNEANEGTGTPVFNDRYHVGAGQTGGPGGAAELSNLAASLGSNDYISFTITTLEVPMNFERIDLTHGVLNAVFDKRGGLQDYDWNIFVMSSVTGFNDGDELGAFTFDRELIDDLDGHSPSGLNASSGLFAQADTNPNVDVYNGDMADVLRSLDLSGVNALQLYEGSVEFRLYFGDSAESDTRVQTVDNIQVFASVPEPSTTLLGLVGAVLMIARRKR